MIQSYSIFSTPRISTTDTGYTIIATDSFIRSSLCPIAPAYSTPCSVYSISATAITSITRICAFVFFFVFSLLDLLSAFPCRLVNFFKKFVRRLLVSIFDNLLLYSSKLVPQFLDVSSLILVVNFFKKFVRHSPLVFLLWLLVISCRI